MTAPATSPSPNYTAWTAINLLALLFGTIMLSRSIMTVNMGISDQLSQPMGKDFFCFWSAGRAVLDGRVLDIFNPKTLAVLQQGYLGAPEGFSIPWFYPPLLLLYLSCAFALLPYKLAYFVYLAISAAAFILLARRFFPTVKPLYVVAFPAFWFNLVSGQNGLLTAVLLIGGLVCLHSRPLLAGALLAGLSYKPQLCLALPIFLLVERRFHTIAAGTVTFVGLILLSTALFGTAVWSVFLEAIQEARNFNHLSGQVRYESFAQLYGTLRVLGVDHALATKLNYGFAAIAAVAAIRFWLISRDQWEKYAVVILLSLLLAPHLIFYDFVATGAIIVWLWPRVSLRPALGLIWAAPFAWPFIASYGIPMLPVAATWILVQLNYAANLDRSDSLCPAPAPG